jgi:hypothetical protein
MSILAKIRGELLSDLNVPDRRRRKAIINLFDAIDSDLDIGYTPSSSTDEALDEYNNSLIELDAEDDSSAPVEAIPPETKLSEVEVKERNTDEVE